MKERNNPNFIIAKLLVLKLVLYREAVKAYFLFIFSAMNEQADVGMLVKCLKLSF